jgi:hypothetical protein
MEIDQQLEQRININFLVKLGKSGRKICKMLQQAYGEDALKRSTVFQMGAALSRGPKRSCRQQNVLPLHAVMKTSIECILACSVTAR